MVWNQLFIYFHEGLAQVPTILVLASPSTAGRFL